MITHKLSVNFEMILSRKEKNKTNKLLMNIIMYDKTATVLNPNNP